MPKRSTINECDSCSSMNSTEIKISVHSSSLRWLVRPPSAVHMQSECLPNTQAAKKECIPLNWLKIIYALGAIFFLGSTKESLGCMETISLREQYTDSCWCALLKNGEKKLKQLVRPPSWQWFKSETEDETTNHGDEVQQRNLNGFLSH